MSLISQIILRLIPKILSTLSLRKIGQKRQSKQLHQSNEIIPSQDTGPECGQLVGSYYNGVECDNCGFQNNTV